MTASTATMNRKSMKLPTIPKGRTGKILLMIGVFVLLAASVSAYSMSSSSTEKFPEIERARTDQADLLRPKLKTGFSVSGTVRINRQFPLGIGFIIAYDQSKMRAMGYSRLDKMGNYKLTDMPPGSLRLLVKKEITDEANAAYEQMLFEAGEQENPNPSTVRKGEKPGELPKVFGKKFPKDYDKIKFDVSTPEFENMPEVKWMTNTAFMKYGRFTEKSRFTVPAGEGDRVYSISLTVP